MPSNKFKGFERIWQATIFFGVISNFDKVVPSNASLRP
jgi:hypothetical protein